MNIFIGRKKYLMLEADFKKKLHTVKNLSLYTLT